MRPNRIPQKSMAWGERRTVDTATYVIAVGVAVAIANFLISVQGIEPLWRVLAISALVAVGVANFLVVLNFPGRFRDWRRKRRQVRALNGPSHLKPDLARLTEATAMLVYENRVGTLLYVARSIEGKAGKPDHIGPRVAAFGEHYQVIRDLGQWQKYWDSTPFVYFIRDAVAQFREIDSILDACYDLAQTVVIPPEIIKQWEVFKEQYNQLRLQWQGYFGRIAGAIGLTVNMLGSPARSLPQPARYA